MYTLLNEASYHLQTGFVQCPSGSLHVSLFLPEEITPAMGWVVHVPAFAEEMNKSRAMVARQARALASIGLAVMVPDLSGTGDSAGTLEEASWRLWQKDIVYLSEWARRQGATNLTLWGNRLGCILAADVARVLDVPPQQLLLWQPVHSGKQHMAQFLRLRMAAGLSKGGSETVAELREKLSNGASLEVAGYMLSRRLFTEIESLSLVELVPPVETTVLILEVVGEPDKPALPVTIKLAGIWRQAGIDCNTETAAGAPYWMTQEVGFAPELINKATAHLSQLVTGTTEPTAPVPGHTKALPYSLAVDSQDNTQAVVFSCGDEQLAGVLHHSSCNSALGVVIVVGGPQYRGGSHRQFVRLAQHLAKGGTPVLRFDYRGMGDSSGQLRGFRHIDADIRSAIDTLQREQPTVTDVVIWGLCDAATAAVFYAPSDSRVKGLILANPWVYSEQGAAKVYLKYYYIQRLFSRDFLHKVLSGKFSFSSSLSSIFDMIRRAKNSSPEGFELAAAPEITTDVLSPKIISDSHALGPSVDLVTQFSDSLAQYTGEVYLILSGNDLTAAEFSDAAHGNRKLRRLMTAGNLHEVKLAGVDHTFSCKEWRGKVEAVSHEAVMHIANS